MLDLAFLPRYSNADIQIFGLNTDLSGNDLTYWSKPRGCSMIDIFCLGAGAGGGGGLTGAASSNRGGGGGGASGGLTRVFCPAFILPDSLVIAVGLGGSGGIANTDGTIGQRSWVGISVFSTASNVIAFSSTGPSNPGTAGTVAVGGSGGTAATVSTPSTNSLCGLGQFNSIVGQDGAAGGFDSNGIAITIPSSSILCQGGSGGGGDIAVDRSGGACTAIANSWLSEQRWATTGTGTNAHGSGGTSLIKPFFSFGGSGGGGSNASTGANGGNGAYGAGGGGGGGGTTGGRGGDGGSGLVIIIAW